MQLLTVLQNISQAADRWGRDRAETIIANHRARVFCSGIGDRATLDYLSSTLGEEEIARISTHRDHALATGSRTYSTDFRHLAAPHRIRQADTNSALLIYGHLAPAWISLRPWYRDRHLKALVTGESTPSATGRPGGLARRLLTRRRGPAVAAGDAAGDRAGSARSGRGGGGASVTGRFAGFSLRVAGCSSVSPHSRRGRSWASSPLRGLPLAVLGSAGRSTAHDDFARTPTTQGEAP